MVTNILRNGSVVKDVTGIKVTRKDVPTHYAIAERIRREKHEKRS
jgi:hypothetical protein